MDIELNGETAMLRVSYQCAASIVDWRLTTIAPSTYRLTGDLIRSTPAYLKMRPLWLCAKVGAVTWRWPVSTIEVLEDGTVIKVYCEGDPAFGSGGFD